MESTSPDSVAIKILSPNEGIRAGIKKHSSDPVIRQSSVDSLQSSKRHNTDLDDVEKTKLSRGVTVPVTGVEKSKYHDEQHISFPPVKSVFMKLRNMSDSIGPGPKPLFYCKICLENNSRSEMFTYISCESHHEFCLSCMKSYTAAQINDGIVIHPCPLIGECNGHATESEIKQLVDDEMFTKFIRFQALKSDPDIRECPECLAQQRGNSRSPIMKCSCGATFCFFHSNAHPNSTCQEYAKRTRSTDKASNRLVHRIAKSCPLCGTDIEKDGGCNHMTCRVCHTEWCWLCGRVAEPNHFDLNNISGCPGGQFLDANRIACFRCCCGCMGPRIPWAMLTYIQIAPQLLFIGLWSALILVFACLAAVLGAVAILVCLPITGLIVCWLKKNEVLYYPAFGFGIFIMSIAVALVQCIYTPLSIICALVLCPIYMYRIAHGATVDWGTVRMFFFYPTLVTFIAITEIMHEDEDED